MTSESPATENAQSFLRKLTAEVIPVAAITKYSEKPGIYGVFFIGDKFPLPEAHISKGILLYIGKTESSQLRRDLKQHLADGQTGHSTLRRTFAALLRTRLALQPYPRSEAERTNRKYTHYKVDDEGECRLTAWMRENLGLAFVPCTCSITDIRRFETEMIRAAVPVLNLTGNPANPFGKQIKDARKDCAALARQSSYS